MGRYDPLSASLECINLASDSDCQHIERVRTKVLQCNVTGEVIHWHLHNNVRDLFFGVYHSDNTILYRRHNGRSSTTLIEMSNYRLPIQSLALLRAAQANMLCHHLVNVGLS